MEIVARPSFGPLLIGLLFSAFFFGVISLQAYLYYYRTHSSRQLYVQLVVAIVWILNALVVCLLGHAEYFYLVTNFLNPSAGRVEIWSLSLHLAISSLVTFIVQCFFIGQIWAYNIRNLLLIGFIFVLIFIRLGVGIAATILNFDTPSFGQSHHENVWLTGCFAVMLPTDVWVTATMIYVLHAKRGLELRCHSFGYKAFLYVMTTGTLPCIIVIVAFLLFFLQNTGLASLAFHVVVGELYTITLFSILYTYPILSSRDGRSGGVRPTVTEDSIATVKSYSKSNHRNELDTHVTESTVLGQKQSLRVSIDGLPSLEYGETRERQVSTSVYEIPMTAPPPPPGSDTINEESIFDRHTSLDSRWDARSSYHVRPASQNTIQTDSTAPSRITGPSMAWESVCSQSFERIGHDVGDVECYGADLRWEPRYS